MRTWWHRLRWATCDMCGREFRKGKGGGVSRRTLCSDACYIQAVRDWFTRTSARRSHEGQP